VDARDSRTPKWTPELRAERWAAFVRLCRANYLAACVPDEFVGIDLMRLPDWIPAGYRDLASVLLTMRDEPEQWKTRLIGIGGDRGRGKSGLGCGLIRAFCRLGYSALYARVRDFFDALDGVPWEQKPSIKDRFTRPDLLVLDEVQVRDSGKAWQDNELTTLIDRRYGDKSATVLLSNLKPDAFMINLGESINRRLAEGYGIYETDWPRLAVLSRGPHPEPKSKCGDGAGI
jgi:hypothetical protein